LPCFFPSTNTLYMQSQTHRHYTFPFLPFLCPYPFVHPSIVSSSTSTNLCLLNCAASLTLCAAIHLTHTTLYATRQTPSDNRMDPVYPRHNNDYDPSAQAVPSQAGINPISPINGTQRTGTPTMPMDSRTGQQPMQYSNSNGGQQAIGVANGNGEFEEPRRNKFLDILCCRMH